LAELQAGFLEFLPRLEQQAGAYFRHVHCLQKKDDLTAEAIAIAWKWYCRLLRRGKNPHEFPATFVHRALCQARAHRRLCGQQKGKDALSPLAQSRHGFITQTLPAHETGVAENMVIDALADNTQTPPPEQVAFRLDFPVWLASLTERKRLVALDLMAGERTLAVAEKHRLSPARVSQLRLELLHSWHEFCGEFVCARA
jgi:hypothetical protein